MFRGEDEMAEKKTDKDDVVKSAQKLINKTDLNTSIETMVTLVKSFYESCKTLGFTELQAMELTKTFLQSTSGRK